MSSSKQDVTRLLWSTYWQSHTREPRNQLILHYTPLVKNIARHTAVQLPANVEVDDLTSCGIFGLIDAIERFDSGRDVKFETYAFHRICGAMLDGLRANDWVPRSLRVNARAVEHSHATMQAALHRAPTDAEVAVDLGMTDSQFQNVLQQVSLNGVAALDGMLRGGGRPERITLAETLADPAAGPADLFEAKETKAELAKALSRLDQRHRTVVALYYFEGMTLEEIGEILGVTGSRVSQIKAEASLRLRDWPYQARRRCAAQTPPQPFESPMTELRVGA
jgi:RNA polymerase sigma factor for flagellar operon FliA